MSTGQVWGTAASGGYMYSDELSDVLRTAVQPLVRWRQFCDTEDASQKGLHRGQYFYWNVFADVATQGGTLVETNTIPETNFTITQGTLTITERANSIPFTEKLDNFSKQPVTRIIQQVLKNDCRKVMDQGAYNQFNATLLVACPTGGTSTTAVSISTTGTSSSTSSVALGKTQHRGIVDAMKERNIPAYSGDDYMAIAHPTTWRALMNDLESVRQYVDAGFQMIMNGEKGRYEGVRIIEQNQVAKETWGAGVSNFAFYFGADTVMEGIVVPEEVRGKIPTDFGRSMGVAWYAMNGFGIVHTTALQSRIVKWGTLG